MLGRIENLDATIRNTHKKKTASWKGERKKNIKEKREGMREQKDRDATGLSLSFIKKNIFYFFRYSKKKSNDSKQFTPCCTGHPPLNYSTGGQSVRSERKPLGVSKKTKTDL